jgi:hypothetical protein
MINILLACPILTGEFVGVFSISTSLRVWCCPRTIPFFALNWLSTIPGVAWYWVIVLEEESLRASLREEAFVPLYSDLK